MGKPTDLAPLERPRCRRKDIRIDLKKQGVRVWSRFH
jgi:hypothetical protein